MTELSTYELLKKDVFYKGWNILEYIANNELTSLDKQTISATIMDALVYKKMINPETDFLNLNNLTITHNKEDYHYEKYPFVSGFPLWLKEKLRTKSLRITGGVPASIFLAKPPSKTTHYCVYDPNTAISAFFPEATFYNASYDSPTRKGIRVDSRPFVEISIDGYLYLVDTLNKRIYKSEEFKKRYNFHANSSFSKLDFNKDQEEIYEEQIEENDELATFLICSYDILHLLTDSPSLIEMLYETEQTKQTHPQAWFEYENRQQLTSNEKFEFLKRR